MDKDERVTVEYHKLKEREKQMSSSPWISFAVEYFVWGIEAANDPNIGNMS